MANIKFLEEQAIDAAVNAKWQDAVTLNEQIIAENGEQIDAYLRLGFAFLQLNKLKEAIKAYKKALQVQPKNIIAIEHLEKIHILTSKKKQKTIHTTKFDPDLFLEIPGKTRTVRLTNLGQKEDLAGRNIGEEVILKEKKRRLEVRSLDNEYIGTLPDDISKRLTYFIQEKSDYKTYIKEFGLSEVVVFIKEISKGGKVRQYPSFPSNPHVMLTDIQHLEDTEEGDEESEEHGDEDDVDMDPHNMAENWEEESDEEDKDLESIIHVEDEDEEEEE